MADLKKFMWEGARTGMALDLYLNRWPKVGSGNADIVESLHVKIHGEGSVLGIKFNISVEIIMPDTSESGTCTIILNGSDPVNCAYKVSGDTLIINHPTTQIKIKDNDKKWTWVNISNPISVWVGAWPRGMNMEHDDNFGDIA